ncbi:hypothetical protein [Marinicella sp. W31]|uniref:hypothetical protein n=1 Tax=Marinicella sp. W31 TaxID=3023713 RepID=UPI003757B948
MNKLYSVIFMSVLLNETTFADTFIVTHTSDPPPQVCEVDDCSLREAVKAANNNSGTDTILLQNETYALILTGLDDAANVGDLDILDDLIIQLVDASSTNLFTIESNVDDRVLDVHPGVDLTIHNGQIKGGDLSIQFLATNGGGIRVMNASLFLNNSQIVSNLAKDDGGGIYAFQSIIQLENTRIAENIAAEKGGGLMLVQSQLQAENSTFESNEATSGGGLYTDWLLANNQTNVRIFDSVFVTNDADFGGGLFGIDNVEVVNSTFSGNLAVADAAVKMNEGSLTMKYVTVIFNDAVDGVDVTVSDVVTGSIQNSIISGSCKILSGGGFESNGGNIESPGDTCEFGAAPQDLISINPRELYLDSNLAKNEGLTLNHAIRSPFSQAIGNAIVINEITTDQRSKPRDSMPDSGAIEALETDFTLIFKNDFELLEELSEE